jgi:hypothetical protein
MFFLNKIVPKNKIFLFLNIIITKVTIQVKIDVVLLDCTNGFQSWENVFGYRQVVVCFIHFIFAMGGCTKKKNGPNNKII